MVQAVPSSRCARMKVRETSSEHSQESNISCANVLQTSPLESQQPCLGRNGMQSIKRSELDVAASGFAGCACTHVTIKHNKHT